VDLTLEVEFALPEFLRKKFFLHTQTIEVNKYRKSNFFKRFFLSESAGMELERIQKNADIEVVSKQKLFCCVIVLFQTSWRGHITFFLLLRRFQCLFVN